MYFKKFLSGAYAIAALLLVVVGFALFWVRLTTGDSAFAPAAGVISPVVVPLPQEQTVPTVTLGGKTIRVTIVEAPEVRQKGLSGRAGLADDEGMLFIFPEDGTYGFWMKDMRFAIDILWLAGDRRVVYMAQNVSPGTYPRVFTPEVPARYVLELHAGFAKAYTIDVGDEVRF